jgi:diguanylate cyclase (GGDEF)-like protein
MWSSANSGHLLLGVVLMLGAMLTASGWLSRIATQEQREAQAWEEHTFEVLRRVDDLRLNAVSIRRGERGFLLTNDEDFLQPYVEARTAIDVDLPLLGQSVSDNAEQLARFTALTRSMTIYLDQAEETVSLQRAGRGTEAAELSRLVRGRQLTNDLMSQLDAFENAERGVLAQRRARSDLATARSDKFQKVLTVTGILLLAIGMIASAILRGAIYREEEARTELKRLVTTDELTGLANRRELFSSLDRMIAQSRRSHRPLALAVLDIDRFKLVNDTYGHPAGDEVIRRVAEMTLLMMREQDLVGRLGGEEFVIVFPDCTDNDAYAACERLRQGIAALPILLPDGSSLTVTVSTGITGLDPEDDRTRLIGRADEALYRAKKSGRDQVQLAA